MTKNKSIKITLISPRTGLYRYRTGVFSFFLRYAPMNLVTLSSLIPEEINATVEILDESVEIIKKESIIADIVGLTGITGVSKRAYSYADYFRSNGITVVMGGPHATLMPQEAKEHVDSVVVGHAYETWPQLLKDFIKGELKDFYYPPQKIDFSKVPSPDKKCFSNKPFITLNSTQAVFGCPNNCEFCVTPVICKGKYEHRPIADVVYEVSHMKGKYITFLDPSPVENPLYSINLYKALKPLKKRWGGLATTRIVDNKELLDAMAESGCFGLLIGFETLSQDSNVAMGKGFNSVDKYYKLVKELHSRGIAIMGCFVHGLETDNKDCFKRTMDFVYKANIDLPRFTICTPFPGTPFFNRLKKEARILTENWTLYDAQHVVFKPKGMAVEELENGHLWCWENAYSLKNILKRLSCSRAFLEYTLLANLGYRFYARGHHRFNSAYMENDWKT
ncbi:hypothetical protein A2526_04735 [candidate division WOR-1 bacterium RIFOXYD2_FULL_36_8]|uniref:Uncharacterized protein n=1 Tax=candidate division WOR-1 bacterium RIFOXYB2_FULL_36_35 TaxID=1802578 RepID=A0A1F4S871_UNCSA|nr:MAG: hypothetical protein A2230_01340 [candidate division WOR-1 bacterium RIFOXYA2_FULL_36_21]OGC14381.1 MAG: hypothetical protein A2282_08015 [candidate division WOR-1 bacterium RIFOXYA12_FULL_36_13]OGC15943.1 MAG: hypothetical protein A2290_06810 [candidate division WOR-1 bacterium RIFOXYB2_FULL_36_35]OGC37269.1 MAG: hypothetical protein A2526_04735 [candidate division WOR-1 bacterium RIFOXYD2_FULL_36_8]